MNKKEKKRISKDCWNLDATFFKWLYKHAKVYLKEASKIVDLEYYKFTYEGEEYTQKALIQLLIYKLGVIIKLDSWDDEYNELGDSIIDIWKLIWPVMWW